MQVCASTSVLMILFSSSAIAISLSFQGLLNVHYAVVFAPACFLGSLLGARAYWLVLGGARMRLPYIM